LKVSQPQRHHPDLFQRLRLLRRVVEIVPQGRNLPVLDDGLFRGFAGALVGQSAGVVHQTAGAIGGCGRFRRLRQEPTPRAKCACPLQEPHDPGIICYRMPLPGDPESIRRPPFVLTSMSRKWWLIPPGLLMCWIAEDMLVPRQSTLTRFDGHEVGRLETAMWRSY
jgi:hypothetical protein